MPREPVAARLELRRLIAAEFERLEALRHELWERQDGPEAAPRGERRYANLLKETIFRATRELDRDWCLSVFADNAGAWGTSPNRLRPRNCPLTVTF